MHNMEKLIITISGTIKIKKLKPVCLDIIGSVSKKCKMRGNLAA